MNDNDADVRRPAMTDPAAAKLHCIRCAAPLAEESWTSLCAKCAAAGLAPPAAPVPPGVPAPTAEDMMLVPAAHYLSIDGGSTLPIDRRVALAWIRRAAHAESQLAAARAEAERLKQLAPLCDEHGSGDGTRFGCPYCAIQRMQTALSRIDYLIGEPNEMQSSLYDVDYDEKRVAQDVEATVTRLRGIIKTDCSDWAEVDDALDAAGVPSEDAGGRWTDLQRVKWLIDSVAPAAVREQVRSQAAKVLEDEAARLAQLAATEPDSARAASYRHAAERSQYSADLIRAMPLGTAQAGGDNPVYISNERLAELAKKHHPPAEWYTTPEEDLFAAGGDAPPEATSVPAKQEPRRGIDCPACGGRECHGRSGVGFEHERQCPACFTSWDSTAEWDSIRSIATPPERTAMP